MIPALKRLYSLLRGVWPTGLILDPDDPQDFEAALKANAVVIRYYAPQLLMGGTLDTYLCMVDVCARKLATASVAADELLAAIASNPRAPTGLLRPTAVHIREASYERVHVNFTALIDPLPIES